MSLYFVRSCSPIVEDRCRAVALAALAADPAAVPKGPQAGSVAGAGGRRPVRGLNRAWRGRDAPTNVLSFAALARRCSAGRGAPLLLGDVVLAFETCTERGAGEGKTLADHLAHLVVHGVLHLLGFDHEVADRGRAMEALETRILAGLGIADP